MGSEDVYKRQVFGSDATLRSWAIQELTQQGDVTQFDGESTKWTDLRDDLATASLFDMGGKRTIVVRNADKFVSAYRPELEKHAAKPGTASRFILELSSLASNTRLYKAIAKDHMVVACSSSTDKKLCLLYTSPSPRDLSTSRMPSSA